MPQHGPPDDPHGLRGGTPQGIGEGDDLYDYDTARRYGITPEPNEEGILKWPSRVDWGPEEGRLLKLPGHPTMPATMEREKLIGNKVIIRNGVMFSFPEGDPRLTVGSAALDLENQLFGGLPIPDEAPLDMQVFMTPESRMAEGTPTYDIDMEMFGPTEESADGRSFVESQPEGMLERPEQPMPEKVRRY